VPLCKHCVKAESENHDALGMVLTAINELVDAEFPNIVQPT